jgi:hypothetical protein
VRKETVVGGGSRASMAGPDSVGRGAGAPVYLSPHGLVVSFYPDSYPLAPFDLQRYRVLHPCRYAGVSMTDWLVWSA